MVITTVLAFLVAYRCGMAFDCALSMTVGFLVVDFAFFGANLPR